MGRETICKKCGRELRGVWNVYSEKWICKNCTTDDCFDSLYCETGDTVIVDTSNVYKDAFVYDLSILTEGGKYTVKSIEIGFSCSYIELQEFPEKKFNSVLFRLVNVCKKRVMISQPMRGLTTDEVLQTRARAVSELRSKGYVIVDTLFADKWCSDDSMESCDVIQKPVQYLAKSLDGMSKCHAVYFCKGWGDARGCRIEHDVAKNYGLEVLYEE